MRTSLLMGLAPTALIFLSFSLSGFLVIVVCGTAAPADAQENPFDTRMGRQVFWVECGQRQR